MASTLVIGDGDFGGVSALYEIQLVNPRLEEMCCGDERGYQFNIGLGGSPRTVSVTAQSGSVGAEDSNAEESGTYYLLVTSDDDGTGEYPIEFTLDVVGPGAPASPTSAAAPPGDQASTGLPSAPVAAVEDSGGNGLLLGVIAALALVVLGLGAVVGVLWRRQGSG